MYWLYDIQPNALLIYGLALLDTLSPLSLSRNLRTVGSSYLSIPRNYVIF
jgi:hypothetical protein